MRLGELRDSRGMTQAQVAEAIGVPVTTYRKYEYGERQTPTDVLISLADLYGVTLDYLFERDLTPDGVRKAQLDALYNLLNDDGKDLVLTIVRMAVKSGDYLSI